MRYVQRYLAGTLTAGALLMTAACSTPQPAAQDIVKQAHPAIPVLALSPSSLGHAMSEQQLVVITAPDGSQRTVQALLEVDAQHVRLALLHMGQRLASVVWDGDTLDVQRSRYLPEQVSPQRVLSDMQLALWPHSVIAQALPQDWQLDVHSFGERQLRYRDQMIVKVHAPSRNEMEIVYVQQGWRMHITNAAKASQPRDEGRTP